MAGRRDLVNRRTALGNQRISLLKGYFPEARELIGEHAASALAVAFLRRWPMLQAAPAAGWREVESFYRHRGGGRKSAPVRHRDVIAAARPLS